MVNMIVINKKSWHYRLAYNSISTNLFEQIAATDLCTYVRQVMKPLLLIILLTLGLMGTILNGYVFFTSVSDVWLWPDASIWWKLLSFWGLLVTVIIAAILVVISIIFIIFSIEEFVVTNVKNYYKERKNYDSTTSIFSEWLKAVKEKTCPLIRLVDE